MWLVWFSLVGAFYGFVVDLVLCYLCVDMFVCCYFCCLFFVVGLAIITKEINFFVLCHHKVI